MRILVGTRKGLFSVRRGPRGWGIDGVSFLADPVSTVLPDARDGALYAALHLGHFGVKLHRSDDSGASWTDLPAPAYPPQPEGATDVDPIRKQPIPWRVEQIWSLEGGHASEPGRLWCGTIPGGLFRSDDRGASWTFIESLWNHELRKQWFGGGADYPGIHSIAVHPQRPAELLLGVSCGGVWQSADSGATWSCTSHGMRAAYVPPEQAGNIAIQDPHRIARCRRSPEVLWCQHHNGVFRSVDGGNRWSEIENVVPSVFGFAVAAHPHDPETAWFIPAAKDEKRVPVDARVVVARTRDGGRSFEVLRRGLPQEHAYDLTYRHALDVDATGRHLAFGSTTGSLWVSDDQGDSWQHLSAHLPPIYCVRFS